MHIYYNKMVLCYVTERLFQKMKEII